MLRRTCLPGYAGRQLNSRARARSLRRGLAGSQQRCVQSNPVASGACAPRHVPPTARTCPRCRRVLRSYLRRPRREVVVVGVLGSPWTRRGARRGSMGGGHGAGAGPSNGNVRGRKHGRVASRGRRRGHRRGATRGGRGGAWATVVEGCGWGLAMATRGVGGVCAQRRGGIGGGKRRHRGGGGMVSPDTHVRFLIE